VISGIGLVDLAMLAVLGVSVVIGLVRGLLFEVMSLVGWVIAYVAARWFAPDLAAQLPIGTAGSHLNHGLAFAGIFVATVIAWSLLARLVRLLLHATPLSLIDRVGGGAFGLLRGGLLLLVLATVVRYSPAAQSPLWQASVGAGWLAQVLAALQPLLPADVGPWLPEGLIPGA